MKVTYSKSTCANGNAICKIQAVFGFGYRLKKNNNNRTHYIPETPVLIPVYNCAKYIVAAIESFLAQKYFKFMKNKAKLAFELLEQEMEVLYKEDMIQLIGGSGGYNSSGGYGSYVFSDCNNYGIPSDCVFQCMAQIKD